MNWEQALKAAREGNKIHHVYFTSDEFFEFSNGRLVCEQGYPMSDWYKNEPWQNEGWSILK